MYLHILLYLYINHILLICRQWKLDSYNIFTLRVNIITAIEGIVETDPY